MDGNASVSYLTDSEAREYFLHFWVIVACFACVVFWLAVGFSCLLRASRSDPHASPKKHWTSFFSSIWKKSKIIPDQLATTVINHSTSRVIKHATSRKKSVFAASFESLAKAVTVDNLKRIETDARALLSRQSPSEETSGQLRTDALLGWFTLYWDIPTTMILPFMTRNVWPESLRIPFHHASSILYLGAGLSYRWVRIAILWISLFVLVLMVALKYLEKDRPKIIRYRSLLARAFYGAAYTVVIYQAGTLLGDYRSCTQGFGEPQAAACKQAAINENYANTTNTTGIEYVMEEVAFDYPTIACCLLVVLWAYCGAIHYTLNDKSASSPAFIWLPVYEAERYTIKTFLSGAGSMFKSFPYVIMPTYLVGFSLALYLTFSYQPCQGQGRKANNLRATGFALGLWFSACGMICIIIDAEELVASTRSVVVSYILLVVGAFVTGRVTWVLNNRRAEKFTLPSEPWFSLILPRQTAYVRKVAADAILMHAEETDGKAAVDERLTSSMIQFINEVRSSPFPDDRFIALRFAGAYLIFASSQRIRGTSPDDSHRLRPGSDTPRVSSRMKSFRDIIFNWKRMFWCRFCVAAPKYTTRNRDISPSGRLFRGKLGTYTHKGVEECSKLIISSIISKATPLHIKRRLCLGFLLSTYTQDEFSFFKVDQNTPEYCHARCIAYSLLITHDAITKEGARSMAQSHHLRLKWLEQFLIRVKSALESSDEQDIESELFDEAILKLAKYFADFECTQNINEEIASAIRKAMLLWAEKENGRKAAGRIFYSNATVMVRVSYLLWKLREDAQNNIVALGFTESCFDPLEEACIQHIAPYVFSTNIKLHAAAYDFVSRMVNCSSASWSSVAGLDPSFGILAGSLRGDQERLSEIAKKFLETMEKAYSEAIASNTLGPIDYLMHCTASSRNAKVRESSSQLLLRKYKHNIVDFLAYKPADVPEGGESERWLNLWLECMTSFLFGIICSGNNSKLAKSGFKIIMKTWKNTIDKGNLQNVVCADKTSNNRRVLSPKDYMMNGTFQQSWWKQVKEHITKAEQGGNFLGANVWEFVDRILPDDQEG